MRSSAAQKKNDVVVWQWCCFTVNQPDGPWSWIMRSPAHCSPAQHVAEADTESKCTVRSMQRLFREVGKLAAATGATQQHLVHPYLSRLVDVESRHAPVGKKPRGWLAFRNSRAVLVGTGCRQPSRCCGVESCLSVVSSPGSRGCRLLNLWSSCCWAHEAVVEPRRVEVVCVSVHVCMAVHTTQRNAINTDASDTSRFRLVVEPSQL